ncbi:transketolase C-terminal domain-containing protein [Labrys neptuniae]|uniref:transketolase family protein n=1 Tax=Labrys TaxID=204476 RepID=UPI00289117BF|nr:transketolase C-terminal domain-containing protein [Labrys neptuniae]MDT3378295.1 transketolase C-terminal domain-containing protein [Labrys neptuniae]
MSAPEAPRPAGAPETFDCRVAFAEELTALARTDSRIVAVCNDSVGSSNLGAFQKEFPDRLINVGIAEQNMVGVGAGLANAGLIPFVCAAAPFLTGRATEQIKADCAYSQYPVVLCGMSPGMAYGELGPTHHSIEDFAWMRAISELTVMAPADPQETRQAVRWAANAGKPVFMRVGRFKIPAVNGPGDDFQPGRIGTLREGGDVTLAAIGTMVSRALEAADLLATQGVSARVLNVSTLKPLDEETILKAARETGRIVTAEEAINVGGLGGAIAETVAQHHPVPMRILGVPGFAPTGDTQFLLDHFGLNAKGIVEAALALLGKGAH